MIPSILTVDVASHAARVAKLGNYIVNSRKKRKEMP